MIKAAWPISLASLSLAAPAQADYVFNPADLPEGFECDPDPQYGSCEEQRFQEAWWNSEYGERYHNWYRPILFDTNLYFADPKRVRPLSDKIEGSWDQYQAKVIGWATPNLVDAHYSIALNIYGGWAFAINRKGILRMVRQGRDEELSQEDARRARNLFPTSFAEMVELTDLAWAFEEAELAHCEGALAHLLAFPAQSKDEFWAESELPFAPGYVKRPADNTIIVTADGYNVFLRASSVEAVGSPVKLHDPGYLIYDQSNGGAGYDWALKMERIARPCLTPSKAMPPWQMLIEAERRAQPQP